VTVKFAVSPALTVRFAGFTMILKSGANAGFTITLTGAELAPVTPALPDQLAFTKYVPVEAGVQVNWYVPFELAVTVARKPQVVPPFVLTSIVIGAMVGGDRFPEMVTLRPMIVEEKSVLQVIELTPVGSGATVNKTEELVAPA